MNKVKIFGQEPAMIAYAVNAFVALLVAYGLDLSEVQVDAIATITTGGLAIVVAVMTRPLVVSSLTGALATLMVAVGAFGLDFTADQVSATTAAVSMFLALWLRANVSPVSGPVEKPAV